MTRILVRLFCFICLLAFAVGAFAAEPLIGTWKLTSQVVDGHKVDTDDLTLRVYPAGDALEFAYSTPVNGIHLVSMKFTAVHLNGTTSPVEDGRNNKIGTVTITKAGPSAYKAVIEGPNRPKAVGRMAVTPDGKTLSSESGPSEEKGGMRAVQTFVRQ
jgi:hypothetical protein